MKKGDKLNLKIYSLFCVIIIFLCGFSPCIIIGEELSDDTVSYVADFKSKSLGDGTKELLGGINMMNDDNLGLCINKRTSAENSPYYYDTGDYLDVNSNELQFKLGLPATDDITLGFKLKMGSEAIYGSATKYFDMLVYQGVIKDVDGDGISERFSVKDSADNRLNIIRNNFSGNYIKAYSYIDGEQSTKDVFVSNESWYEVTIEADFVNNDGEILYNIDTYINGELYGTIEIPKIVTSKVSTTVMGSKGYNSTYKAGTEFGISGPSHFSMITADGTLIKDVYIHSGLRKSGETINSSSYKAEYADEIIVEESFNSSYINNKIEFRNFDKASYERESSAMMLSYTGDGNSTGKDMAVSPSVCISGTSSAEMYRFNARFYFGDYKLERKLMQLIFTKDGTVYEGSPIITILRGSVMRESEMIIPCTDGNGDVITHKANVVYQKWYNAEVIIDLSGDYPVYTITVTDDSGNILFDGIETRDTFAPLSYDNVYMQIRMDSKLEETNKLTSGETTSMKLDDICWMSLYKGSGLSLDNIKMFSGNRVMTGLSSVSEGTVELNALLSNHSRTPVNGVVLACQYSLSGEMLLLSKCGFNVAKAYAPFETNNLPTSDIVSLELNLHSDMSYIKLFVLDSLNMLVPYTSCVKYGD